MVRVVHALIRRLAYMAFCGMCGEMTEHVDFRCTKCGR